jgi:hypothetical protein
MLGGAASAGSQGEGSDARQTKSPDAGLGVVFMQLLPRYGSSDILYSNGRPARFTNPRGIGTLCKHLYVVLPLAISSWSQEAPEEKAVEEPQVKEVPQVPDVAPEDEPPPEEDLAPVEDEEEEEIRGASYVQRPSGLYVPSRLSHHAQTLRSLALPFDSECC